MGTTATKTSSVDHPRERIADDAIRELAALRPSHDAVGAAVAAAGLLARRVAAELSDRDRLIRIARREGATLRALADATGLSRQTIANICASARAHPSGRIADRSTRTSGARSSGS